MSRYFRYFPQIKYNDNYVVDITRRAKVLDNINQNPYGTLPYTVRDGEGAEDIAYHYYGDQAFVWLVYMANNIIDPYSQWPMNSEQFNEMIIKKYAEVSGETGTDVVNWTLDTTTTDNIAYYRNVANTDILVTKATYTLDPSIVGGEWEPLRYYDYELLLNDNKRAIYLVNNLYATQVERELESLMNG